MHAVGMKPFAALIASILIISPGRQNRSAEATREQPPTHRRFGVAEAMQIIYGNYDTRDRSSTAFLPSEERAGSARSANKRVKIRPFFSTFVDAGTERTFVIATYAVPIDEESFDCHACVPTIGMAIFPLRESNRTIDSSNQVVTYAGGWGRPPADGRLVSLGLKDVAVMVRDSDTNFGETSEELLILAPWRRTANLSLDRVIADDNKGQWGPEEFEPCYSHRRTIRFLHAGNEEYFRLEMKLSGADLLLSNLGKAESPRRVHGLEILKFENGVYVSASRQGEVTRLDRPLAEHSRGVSP